MGKSDPGGRAAREAADWVARRDCGLAAAEQDAYLQWLQADASHPGWIARHEATLGRMRGLSSWQPVVSQEANPDLFAPRRRSRRWLVPLLATAAAVAVGIFLQRPEKSSSTKSPATAAASAYLRVNEREALEDGSLVELRDGSRIEVRYTAHERRVRLVGGEAHFTVAHNPSRPFIVEAGDVSVRAVGTAFNVRFDPAAVDVVVTEGRVQVESTTPATDATVTSNPPVLVSASQRTVVALAAASPAPAVVSVSPTQLREVLAWQAPRLQFHETPLAEAVAEFNRHNCEMLVLGDGNLGRIPIGGTFRADNVEGFVRLLEVTLGIRGDADGPGRIVLRRAP